ncbi:MAG: hypothetical protein ABI824_05135 [Acidobacteriota bacterium]
MFAGSAAMRFGGRIESTTPAVIALIGMPGHCAVFGSCANVTPPAALMALNPNVPSDPVPESTTPMAARCCSSASATGEVVDRMAQSGSL